MCLAPPFPHKIGLLGPGSSAPLCDNNPAICLTNDPNQHTRSKHIDARHYYVRERTEDGMPSADNIFLPNLWVAPNLNASTFFLAYVVEQPFLVKGCPSASRCRSPIQPTTRRYSTALPAMTPGHLPRPSPSVAALYSPFPTIDGALLGYPTPTPALPPSDRVDYASPSSMPSPIPAPPPAQKQNPLPPRTHRQMAWGTKVVAGFEGSGD